MAVILGENSERRLFYPSNTFTCMRLADALIQRNLQKMNKSNLAMSQQYSQYTMSDVLSHHL